MPLFCRVLGCPSSFRKELDQANLLKKGFPRWPRQDCCREQDVDNRKRCDYGKQSTGEQKSLDELFTHPLQRHQVTQRGFLFIWTRRTGVRHRILPQKFFKTKPRRVARTLNIESGYFGFVDAAERIAVARRWFISARVASVMRINPRLATSGCAASEIE